jgi:arylsulfatase A-like enzyme/tetratricopeptide (TPR) repeat protein
VSTGPNDRQRKSRTRKGPAAGSSRFPVLRGAVVGIVVAAAAIVVAILLRSRGARADLRPIAGQNVLLVTIDTLRADALGCYGGPVATPNLDRLARQGMRFDFAHAHAVVTLPSHASILTGRYPFEHGIRDNSGYRLGAGTPTLATLLKAAGYHTAAFIGGFPLNARFGLTPGFDVYDDRLGETHGPVEFAMPERRADAVVAAARAWIAAQPTRWFAWVHLFDAHAPYQPPPPFDRQYGEQPYYGEVAYVDQQLAPLVESVRAQTRPTLIVVTADHGEALGDHGEATHGLFAYESTLRVPLIVAQSTPGRDAPERSDSMSDQSVRHVDLLPTILGAVSLEVPAGLPGRSLLAATSGFSGTPRDNEGVASYFEAMSASLNRGWAPLNGVLAGREKYISLPLPELYDLATDPREAANVVNRDLEHRRVLEARLAGWNASPAGARTQEDAETAARLRALGYVSSGSASAKGRYTENDDPKRLIDVDAAIHRGIQLFEAGRRVEALGVYQQIVGQRPDLAVAVSHLAFIYWSEGDVRSAIGTLKHALAGGVTQSGIPTQLGVYLAETGSPKDALPLLQAASGGADVDALNALGITYGHLGDAKRALDTFQGILRLDPQNVMAYQNIASVDVQRGDLRGARDALERALAIDPKSARAYTGLGAVQLKEGRREEALQSWRRAVELDPSDYDALFDLASELVDAGRLAEARPFLERFIRSAPAAQYARDIRRFQALLASR